MGKLRFTRLFSMAGPACHLLPGCRGVPSKASRRRGHSEAPKGWRRGSREFWESRPHGEDGAEPRKWSVEMEMNPCTASRGTGWPALAVSPPAVSARLPADRPSSSTPPRPRASCPFLPSTFVDLCADCSLFSSLKLWLRLPCGWPVLCPGVWPKGHRQDGLSTGLWSAGLPPWVVAELPSDHCTPGPA